METPRAASAGGMPVWPSTRLRQLMAVSNRAIWGLGPFWLWEVEAIVDARGGCEKGVWCTRRKEQPKPNRGESWCASCKHSHLMKTI